MRRAWVVAVVMTTSAFAMAEPASAPSMASSTTASAPPASSGSMATAGPLPPGAELGALPAGHPHVDPNADPNGEEDGEDGDASAGAGGQQMPKIPRDGAEADPRLAPGMIVGRILDESERPVVGETVTLGILRNSVALGEARSRTTVTTDGAGNFRFTGLKIGTGWSYRVSITDVGADPRLIANYGLPPFNLPLDHGFQVVIHRFPITGSLDSLMAAVGGVDTNVEVRDDVVEVSQIFEVINASTTTWALGEGLTLKLPEGYKAVREAETMEDHKVTDVEGVGVKWTGAFAPGQWRVAYDFKIPYDGEEQIDMSIELPPRVLAARVRTAAKRGMDMTVDGFPAAKAETNELGVRILSAVKQGTPQDQMHALGIHIRGLPSPGPARWIAMVGALLAVAIGIVLANRPPPRVDNKKAAAARAQKRAMLFEELDLLDRGRQAGDVGPQAYAHEREKIVDAIALTLGQERRS